MHLSRLISSALWRALAFVPVLGIISCSDAGGEKLSPASGKVTYNDQPAAGASVVFHPKNAKNELTVQRPTAVVQPDGTFTLSTGANQGAPVGEYAVTVTWYGPVGGARKVKQINTGDEVPMHDKLKGAYADKSRSGLTRQIKQGPNQLEPIVLK